MKKACLKLTATSDFRNSGWETLEATHL